ncbi:MAG: DUF4032 domain-containing protein [Omnitrophica WOR_2 bacterium]
MGSPLFITIRPGFPDFLDLPWNHPLDEWKDYCSRLEEAPRGLSRHPVAFVNYDGVLYAIKELPGDLAKKEYDLLLHIEELHLPVVIPVGFARTNLASGEASILITRYLDHSLPYRSLFTSNALERYRGHLLDAMAGLLVQLHLVGVFWGDCSLSNTLFRRDAGTLQANLVDAETAEIHPPRLSPTLRYHDLQIMEENVDGEVAELSQSGALSQESKASLPNLETGAYISQRYQSLWDEITREQVITPDEHYRIQERTRALNTLGFSVGGIEMQPDKAGDRLRLRVVVTDRNFHRNQLISLTGVDAQEKQAQAMMNEIQQIKAMLSQANNRSTPLSVAAFNWLENNYRPTIKALEPLLEQKKQVGETLSPAEAYCQVLEHKWYLSERAHHDVGHQAAVDDYLTLQTRIA